MAEQIVKLLTVRLVAFTKYTLEHAELEFLRRPDPRSTRSLSPGVWFGPAPHLRIAFTEQHLLSRHASVRQCDALRLPAGSVA